MAQNSIFEFKDEALPTETNVQTYVNPDFITETKPIKEDKHNIFSDKQIIDSAFQYFRKAGFPYRKLELHEMMQDINELSNTKTESLIHTNNGLLTADTFSPHRFAVEVEGYITPLKGFEDEKVLKHALELQLSKGNIGTGYFSALTFAYGIQAASNFRPGFALYYYRKYCKEGYNILDTSMGYGGRMTGYIASKINGSYTAIDPNIVSIEGNQKLANTLGFQDQIHLINSPVEDLDPKLYENKFDFQFTSPPYYSKEHYSNDPTQSWKRYNLGIFHWVNGFLKKMLAFQYTALKPGSYSVVNINDVIIKNHSYPLVKYTIDSAKEIGFIHEGTDKYPIGRVCLESKGKKESFEPVLIFQKPQ